MSSVPAPVPTVSWRADGTPFSPRFDDVYRSAGLDGHGGLEQARGVFLQGCGLLPESGAAAAWAHAPRWAILETGFGLGLNFLAAWHAWRQDSERPTRLFYTSVEAYPPNPSDLLRSAAAFPELAGLSRQLAAQWHGLVRGFHRLYFERERVVLTLIVDDIAPALKELAGRCDSVFLDGFSPARNPAMWRAETFGAIARHARAGTRAATWCVAHEVRERLAQSGFQTERVPGVPPKRHALRARFSPVYYTKTQVARTDVRPARCIVIGGGLAGACAAWSLAERGWQVTVLDRAQHPAAGASAVPAGIFAPHVSADDCLLSQLTRAGIAATQARAARLLRPGIDFSSDGVLELHLPGKRRLPAWWDGTDPATATAPESLGPQCTLTLAKARAARVELSTHRPALWHAQAGWMRPAALVEASLSHSNITWRGGTHVAHVLPEGGLWRLVGSDDRTLDRAELVVVAAGCATQALLPDGALPLRALRGQIAWGPWPAGADSSVLPPFPVNGQGYLIGRVPGTDAPHWVLGSTFERSGRQPVQRVSAHAANWAHLHALLPGSAQTLAAAWRRGDARAWAGVRATLPDHLPAVGPWLDETSRDLGGAATALGRGSSPREKTATGASPRLPLHLCTALGARGLTLAVLCGELLAAHLHDEPLPVARSLAAHLRASRYATRVVRRG
jgi:tRNA 5-methylaminomethyl-2-thiouridine biosynthesis bifunctional protein